MTSNSDRDGKKVHWIENEFGISIFTAKYVISFFLLFPNTITTMKYLLFGLLATLNWEHSQTKQYWLRTELHWMHSLMQLNWLNFLLLAIPKWSHFTISMWFHFIFLLARSLGFCFVLIFAVAHCHCHRKCDVISVCPSDELCNRATHAFWHSRNFHWRRMKSLSTRPQWKQQSKNSHKKYRETHSNHSAMVHK